jgi:hypothetical protein
MQTISTVDVNLDANSASTQQASPSFFFTPVAHGMQQTLETERVKIPLTG